MRGFANASWTTGPLPDSGRGLPVRSCSLGQHCRLARQAVPSLERPHRDLAISCPRPSQRVSTGTPVRADGRRNVGALARRQIARVDHACGVQSPCRAECLANFASGAKSLTLEWSVAMRRAMQRGQSTSYIAVPGGENSWGNCGMSVETARLATLSSVPRRRRRPHPKWPRRNTRSYGLLLAIA
jgi:hypothetical protein